MKFAAVLMGLAFAANAATPAPVLSSVYHVADLGLVDFSMAGGEIIGRYKASGACAFAPDSQVVSGTFEGNVFVGWVAVCQEGLGCDAERKVPLLAVWHGDELLGTVHLSAGCSSPALERNLVLFRPATVDEKKTVIEGTSAAALATKNAKKDPVQQLTDMTQAGQQQLERHDYRSARATFESALAYRNDYWPALVGLGVAQVKLKDPSQGLETLDRALTLSQKGGAPAAYTALIHFNIACARAQQGRKKEALNALSVAVKTDGASVLEDLTTDADLAGLRSDAEFRRLAEQAKTARDRAARKPR